MYYLFLLMFFIFSAFIQTTDVPEYESYKSSLVIGEALEFENKAIRFKEVLTDSRCPKGVTCIWAGEAQVLVELFSNGSLCGEEVLTISGGMDVVSLQQLFPEELIKVFPAVLSPYPDVGKETKPGEYKLSLEVRVEKE